MPAYKLQTATSETAKLRCRRRKSGLPTRHANKRTFHFPQLSSYSRQPMDQPVKFLLDLIKMSPRPRGMDFQPADLLYLGGCVVPTNCIVPTRAARFSRSQGRIQINAPS